MIGLVGAHRSGKTTMAEGFARRRGIAMFASDAMKVQAEMGLDPARNYPLETRLEVQSRILDRAEAEYRAMASPFIADRTPCDYLAYMLADIQHENVPDKLDAKLMDYIDRCFDVLGTYFQTLVVVPSVLPYKAERGKPLPIISYQEHVGLLATGIAGDLRCAADVTYLAPSCVALEERLVFLDGVYSEISEEITELREAVGTH